MATPVIRPARVDEAHALSDLALRSKASWGYSQGLMTLFEAELTLTVLDLEDVMVIEVEGKPGGFYSLQPVSQIRAELGHLFVEPRLQRRGFGRLMLADALRRAGARGFGLLEIQGDPNAARFYERVGATCVGERESESVPGRMLPLFEIAVP
jgi:GNAT superfamily N-acetyltransferase